MMAILNSKIMLIKWPNKSIQGTLRAPDAWAIAQNRLRGPALSAQALSFARPT